MTTPAPSPRNDKPVGTCLHCRRDGVRLPVRGLCRTCYKRLHRQGKAALAPYPRLYRPVSPSPRTETAKRAKAAAEMTQAEVDAMVEERMAKRPKWFDKEPSSAKTYTVRERGLPRTAVPLKNPRKSKRQRSG